MDLKREISKNPIALLVVAGENFAKNTTVILKTFSKDIVCYTTINKGVDALLDVLAKNKIKKDNFFFIDAVTKTILEPRKQVNCVFVSSPSAITELGLEISKCIEQKFPVIIIDSLSTLSIYHPVDTLSHFVHHLINKTRTSGKTSLLFMISDKDKEKDLYRAVEPFMDKVVYLK